MKKPFILATFLLVTILCGCTGRADVLEKGHALNKTDIEQTKTSYNWTPMPSEFGSPLAASNEKGMYFFKKNPDASETIRYVDFELKVEIALCSKPECQHNSNTCNAWFPYMGGSHNLVLSDDKLYVLFSAADEQWIEKYGDSAIAHIEKMDLDGGNREYLCEIPNMLPNSGFGGYVFDNKKIYIMCNTAKKQGDGVTVEPNLLSIDQNSGQIEVEASNDSLSGMKNPRIF